MNAGRIGHAATDSVGPGLRILIFHGYLLRGTGSNIYNASLCRALARAGHEVHLFCQDRDPPELGCRIHVPDIRGVLPVNVHGSALEYTVRPHPERFLPYALEGLRDACGVLVGSRHTAESLWEVTGEPDLPERTRLGPPGVDVEAFRPLSADGAAERLTQLAARLEGGEAAAWGGEEAAGERLGRLDPARDRIVAFVGKLIVSKGVDLLLAAWPLVLAEVPEARLVIVGFGEYREGLERLLGALGSGDLEGAREVASRGRELEGGRPGELEYLAAFLDGLEGIRRRAYLE